MAWYRMNTHAHVGAFQDFMGFPDIDPLATPDYVVEWYREHGYQALVMTEHERVLDVSALNAEHGRDDFLVIAGQEITQALVDPDHPGGLRQLHVNAVAIDRETDAILPVGMPESAWRFPESMEWPSIDATTAGELYERHFERVRAAGGIPQVNHPNFLWSVTPEDLLALSGPYLLEVWNAHPYANNLGGGADGSHAISTEELWDLLLTAGATVWATASDDAHDYHLFDRRDEPTPGKGWIVVDAARLTETATRESLRTGRFYASTGIDLARVQGDGDGLSIEIGSSADERASDDLGTRYVTRFVGEGGETLAVVSGTTPAYRFRGGERYVRASITDSDGRRAWVQPTFREAADA